MKQPTFLNGIVVAVVLAFAASVVVATLTPFMGLGAIIRLLLPGLALAYLLYLLSRSGERIGRITTLSLWSILAAVTWWLAPPLPLYLLIHVAAIWLLRSLYFYAGVFPALLDLGLGALSISATVWAITRSGSVFLATWCFFLVQALFVAIPPAVGRPRRAGSNTAADNVAFEQAKRHADAALRQLLTR